MYEAPSAISFQLLLSPIKILGTLKKAPPDICEV